ncbi:MAG: ABC transporter ATP-binding protein [Candidatus Omnitrophica bacterium]|nr:ABC transporter ATP-binding protein [Candidatus Omnitrophota bacterium]MDD5236455.1 ABC transporter ATP-binding protein [Candidatus Omnitrophota bacterium]MDD5610509.1 ABC transporter ATP-binding protein [Candidatus Omnitrophota bacterium]
MPNIIEAINVSKNFISPSLPWQKRNFTPALSNINLKVPASASLALLGPNGAGKTTLLKIIATLILPDKGKISVDGNTLGENDEKIKSLVGLTIPEERSFYWRLTGKQNLEFFAALYGLNKKECKTRLEQLFKLFGVDYENRRFDGYSSGMKRKFSLIRTLLHEPKILLLDEPMKSLDYNSACELEQLIRKESSSGRTVILATHNMQEAENLCNTFAILHKGSIYGYGSLDELRNKIDSPSASLTEIYLKLTENA